MADHSFFDAPNGFESIPNHDDSSGPVGPLGVNEAGEAPLSLPPLTDAERFACERRLIDLTHTATQVAHAEAIAELESPASDQAPWPTHAEIIELIESVLVADPDRVPASEAVVCQRPHAVYLPEHYEHRYAYPLLVWFHDEGGSEAELNRMMTEISDRNYIGVALRGDVALESGGYGWSTDSESMTALLQDVERIALSLRREYHIHSERIYVAGLGKGAAAAVEMLIQKPEWFGGAISLNGAFPSVERRLARRPELKNKRILLATSTGSTVTKVGDIVAHGRLLYSVGMHVGTRVYQETGQAPSRKMLRDVDAWLMDDICSPVSV